MDKEFPFNIRDVAYLLNLHVRHEAATSWDTDCPFCSGRGKLNLNLKKNVFRCNRCGENGGMLALYGKVYGVDNKTAKEEIEDTLGRKELAPAYESKKKSKIKLSKINSVHNCFNIIYFWNSNTI